MVIILNCISSIFASFLQYIPTYSVVIFVVFVLIFKSGIWILLFLCICSACALCVKTFHIIVQVMHMMVSCIGGDIRLCEHVSNKLISKLLWCTKALYVSQKL